ncbi:MAG TPA: ferritin-like domain-containing protein [Stenomitos sp.]
MDGKIRDPEQIIALFNHNVGLEHGAIFQYLTHAYAIGEAGVGAEIINISRSEMRHLKYFAGIITELGGTVTLERPNVLVRADSIVEMMRLGVEAEGDAIRDYTSQLDRIDHPGALRILERVIMDEQFHQTQFAGFEAEVREMAQKASYPKQGTPTDPALVQILQEAFQDEYNHLLTYLRHYFQADDWEAKDFLFENAYWRMKHMSLIADHINEENADPNFLWNPRPVEGSLAERVAQAIELEQTDLGNYVRRSGCPIPPEVRELFKNITGHARYQEGQMKLLRDLMTTPGHAAPGYAPFGGPGPMGHQMPVAGRAPEEHGPATPHGESFETEVPPARPQQPSLTVGSLLNLPKP